MYRECGSKASNPQIAVLVSCHRVVLFYLSDSGITVILQIG